MIKINQLRQKSIQELNNKLKFLLIEKFNLNIKLVNKKLNKTHLLRNIKRDIARIKTLLTEKQKIKN